MRVIGFDPFATDVPRFVERVGDLEALWRESDVVSLHCPLTADNARMVNADTLGRCKPGVILVNTARGGLVDEDALLAAIRSGHVAAAGLDSFASSRCRRRIRSAPSRSSSSGPHIGGVTADAYVAMGVGAAKNVLASLARRGA
jgi:D-3-phosphoglycerate dehydrogenase